MKWFFKKEEMKANAGAGVVFIARDYYYKECSKCVKQFASVESHAVLAAYIQALCDTGEEACIYEIVPYNTPCKLYFDIEWTAGPNDDTNPFTIRKIVEYIDSLLCEAVADAQKRKCEILESTRVGGRGGLRYSYHVVYPGIAFSNNTESMKAFTTRVHRHFETEKIATKNPIDLSVYSRDRLFRAPFCWKANDAHKTQMKWIDGVSTLCRLENCLVTKLTEGCVLIGGPLAQTRKQRIVRLPRQVKQETGGGGVCFSGMSVNIESCRQRLQRIMIMYGGMGSLRFYKVCENTFSSGNYMLFRYEHSVPGREEPCLAHGIGSKVMSVTSAPQ